MEKIQIGKRIVYLETPSQTVKLEHCPKCGISTTHRMKDGEWKCSVCMVKTIDPQAARLDHITYELATGHAELTDGLYEELGELLDDHNDWLDEMNTRESNRY